ncbi:hypothetical protein CBR_g39134 [Chara braunii]|uniref:Protein kinase domain-containing protein n=1 Tax=Chara braunii TaxID=69332 RepID=A0A388LR00_CHABU|nr:hypothetical protein CBR_g39134 [Chara braunii]|eukprot:GBG84756.1 hypothetical protein CBR_g39134 [Chara braunii]
MGGLIILLDWDRDLKMTTFEGRSRDVLEVVFHPIEPDIFASASMDGTVKIWDIEKKSASRTLQDTRMETVWQLSSCSDMQKSLLVTGDYVGEVRIWDYETGDCKAKIKSTSCNFFPICFFHPLLPYIFTTDVRSGKVEVWSESSYELLSSHLLFGPQTVVTGVPSNRSNLLVLAGSEGSFMVVEVIIKGKEKEKVEEKLRLQSVALANRVKEEQRKAFHAKVELEKRNKREVSSIKQKYAKRISGLRKKQRKKERMQAKSDRRHEEDGEASAERLEKLQLKIQELQADKEAVDKRLQESQARIQDLRAEKEVVVDMLEGSSRRIREWRETLAKEVKNSMMPQPTKDASKEELIAIIRQLESERTTRAEKIRKSEVQIEQLEQRLKKRVRSMGGVLLREYSYQEIERAADSFDVKRRYDNGDPNGNLYRGKLICDVTPVIVKKRVMGTGGRRITDRTTFKMEVVDKLEALKHPHLLTLLGVCYGENCLVYEHMENGNLKDWILCAKERPARRCLPWYDRLRVMAEVVRAVSFLHSTSLGAAGGPIIHGAIRPANIFLDEDFVAKVGEVDQALLAPDRGGGVPRGAQGDSLQLSLGNNSQYIAPEYFRTGVFDEKTDMYAIGITVLEMLTGKFWNALGILEDAIGDDAAFKNALDPNAGGWDVNLAREVAGLGLSCASLNRCKRPKKIFEDVLPSLEGVVKKVALAESQTVDEGS